MKILFTGCSGFIGSVVLDKAIRKYGNGNLCILTSSQIKKDVKTIIHNNYDFNPNIFIENGAEDIEILVHAGAFIPKNYKEVNDILKCNSNIINTEKLLFAKMPNLKRVIFISTLDVYSESDTILESTQEQPISLYGFSKLYCEKMIENFSNQNNLISQILRIGHVFGPGEEKYEKIIPLTISKILNGKDLEIFGDGEAIRTFIYVDDVAEAIINSIDLCQDNGIINIVGNEQITIKELVEKIVKIHDNKNINIKYIPNSSINRNIIFDNSKLKKTLLNHFTSLEEGLRKEYDYMRNKNDKYIS
jgi:nucleoside-diphosphate-sugar epimerase